MGVQVDKQASENRRRNLLDLIRDYHLAGRERRFRILPDSPLVGKALQDLGPRRQHGANIIAIEREKRFRRECLSAGAHAELRASDVLLVDVRI
ncbi:MAG: TrkA C-terminal domain-containing protein [Verrucomicrobia bacterium]|nr:TrkA C-terminal domain-containing protein [Verrucomicrobiota bacterium]